MDSNRKNDKFKMYNNKIILSIYYYAGINMCVPGYASSCS